MITRTPQALAELGAIIRREAHKEPIALNVLSERAHRRVIEAVQELTDDQGAWRAGDAHDSVLEVMRHLVASKRRVARICAALAQGEPPPESNDDTARALPSLTWARAALDDAQLKIHKFVDMLWPMTDLEKRYPEEALGPLNCKEWAVWQALHDSEHAAEIARIVAHEGFPEAEPEARAA